MIVGLSGYAQSGKDTFGRILVEEHGFERLSFADTLRDMLYALNPRIGGIAGRRVQDAVDAYGWDVAKVRFIEIRTLLQRLGTEAGRQVLGDNIWVDTAMSKVGPGNYVVTDVRFPNEALAIGRQGGIVLRVSRPGTRPVNPHPSETALDDFEFDGLVDNSSDLENLRKIARTVAAYAGPGRP